MKRTAENFLARWRQPSWAWVLACLAALGLLAVAQVAAGEDLVLAPLYVIPVVLATWFAGLSRGLAVAFAALAAWLWGLPADAVGSGFDAYLQAVLIRAFAYVSVAVLMAALRSASSRHLPQLTASDCLDGVLPASQFRDVVTLELAHAHRDALPVACAYLEVTGFRLVSERHGPTMALAMLSMLGRCMRRCLRRADLVGRLGAERFLVLLPETAAVDATALVERLRGDFETAVRSCPDGVSLRVVMLAYERSPATLDDLVRDIKALVSASRSSGAAGCRSATR